MFLTSCPVLHLLPRQSLHSQVHLYTVHPPPLRSSFPSLLPNPPLSLSSHVFVIPSSRIFFVSLLITVHLCNTTHPSLHPHFCHIQLLPLRFLRCACLSPVHNCQCLHTFPLTFKLTFLSQNPSSIDMCRKYVSNVLRLVLPKYVCDV